MTLRAMLDTNIVSHLMRTQSGRLWDRALRLGDGLCISTIVAAELRFGAARRGSPQLSAAVEERLASLTTLPFEPPADRCYADIRAELERRGIVIGPNDLFIAAHALALDLTLVTANIREFSRVPGLRVENWLD